MISEGLLRQVIDDLSAVASLTNFELKVLKTAKLTFSSLLQTMPQRESEATKMLQEAEALEEVKHADLLVRSILPEMKLNNI